MVRDLDRLAGTIFDVLVVGAGIYGVTIARDAALRGLSVALIDRADFGAGTSFNSLKTIHGGLRELQHAALRETREFVRERRALSRIASHLVHPLPFVIPTYRHPVRNRLVLRLVLAVNDLVARDRNDGLAASKHLPAGRVIGRAECLRLCPAIDPRGVTGGAVWYDCQMYSADRLGLAFVSAAAESGVAAANYVEADALLADGARVAGVRARDREGTGSFEIRARLVINAAGPWAWTVLESLEGHRPAMPPPAFSKALNLVTRPITGDHAIGGLADGRFLFAAPWRGVSVIGTSHDLFAGRPDELLVTRQDIDALLGEAARAFPRAALTRADLRLVHRGLLPAAPGARGHEGLLKRSLIVDHRADGLDGLITVVGVRYTTARATAARVVDRAFALLGRPAPACRTDVTPVTGGDLDDFSSFERQAIDAASGAVAEATVRRLVRCYGTRHPRLLELMRSEPALAGPLSADCPVTGAEIVFAARHEMALHLSDALIRRTDAGSAGHPGARAIMSAAALMAAARGWSPQRVRAEIDLVERFYRIDDSPEAA